MQIKDYKQVGENADYLCVTGAGKDFVKHKYGRNTGGIKGLETQKGDDVEREQWRVRTEPPGLDHDYMVRKKRRKQKRRQRSSQWVRGKPREYSV